MLANVMRGGCTRGFVAMPEAQDLVMYLLRWIHFVAGITWIGLLYFFNFVNTPAMKVMDATARPFVTTTLLPRALAWFRHGAWVTVLAGLVMIYLKYWANGDIVSSNNAKTILTGSVLGVIMLANVWGIIWPNQKRIIEATAATDAWLHGRRDALPAGLGGNPGERSNRSRCRGGNCVLRSEGVDLRAQTSCRSAACSVTADAANVSVSALNAEGCSWVAELHAP